MYREAYETVLNVSKTFKTLIVTGPPEVGKTTLIKKCLKDGMKYISLNDITLREYINRSPKEFLKEYHYPLCIEQIEYGTKVFPYIKMNVDEYKERGMYHFTSTQKFDLMKNVTESLAGRIGIIEINSLTYSEIVGNKNKKLFNPDNITKEDEINENELYEIMFKGGMPKLYVENIDKNEYFSSYIDNYIDVEVVKQIGTIDKDLFKMFMIDLAKSNGMIIDYKEMSNKLKISKDKIVEWLDVLVTSGLVYLLTSFPFNNDYSKVIFMDSGLCSYLAGFKFVDEFKECQEFERYLKSFVISEIVKSSSARGRSPFIMYYRDKKEHEIDLMFFQNNTYYPFMISKNILSVDNLEYLKVDRGNIGIGGVICFEHHYHRLNGKNYAIPIGSVINPSNKGDTQH